MTAFFVLFVICVAAGCAEAAQLSGWWYLMPGATSWHLPMYGFLAGASAMASLHAFVRDVR